MSLKRIVVSGTVVLLLSISGLTATPSDVANAVMTRDQAAVRALLAQRADVNAPQADGATALHWAAYWGDVDIANVLISAGANVQTANRHGITPLSLASINGDAAMIAALVKGGADPNERLPTGKTNLMLAARNGNIEALKVLLDEGANINAKEALRGTTPLMWAADESHPTAVQFLIQRGADIKARSNSVPRGIGPELGIGANDQRKQVAAQVAALARGAALDLNALRAVDSAVPNAATATEAVQPGQGAAPARAAVAQNGSDGDSGARVALMDGGGLTALVYAARSNDLESTKLLLAAGADVNEVTTYGWSPLLVATQNRNYKLGSFLLDRGADPNKANNGGWTPLYLAVDNRNIEAGDYPVRKADIDHLEYIKILLNKGADVNARMKDNTETRTVFTRQWVSEEGATAFLRASQSGDLILMKLLLAHGADPKIATVLGITALHVAAGIGWVDGVTTEWSERDNLEAVNLLLDLGIDPNTQADTGHTALHGAAHKGRPAVVQLLVDHGAKLDIRDYGNTDNRGGKLAAHTWLPVDYADGLVRVGVQSAIAHPETGLLIRKLMTEKGMPAPPMGRTLESICITEACE